MNWALPTSLDQIWRSPSFPTWPTLAAAGFFAIIMLITLLRAERSVANGALTVITLLAVGIAVASQLREDGVPPRIALNESRSSPAPVAALPALFCIDDLAGDTVEQACEKVLFGSAEATAAAVSYAASSITRLTALGDAAAIQRAITPEIQGLRRAVERDRYGLVAQVLLARDRCTPTECAAYRSLTDNHQIITNMDERLFDHLVARYAPSWNTPSATAATTPLAMLPTSLPTGRPTNAEFPSAANTPAVSIMTPEPGTGTAAPGAHAPAQAATAPVSAARAQTAAPPAATPPAAAKRQAPKRAPAAVSAPTQISPAAQAPAASND